MLLHLEKMGKSLIIFWNIKEWYVCRAGHWWKRLSLFWEPSPVSWPPHACLLMFCLALLPGLDLETMLSTCEESLITFTFSQWTVAFCDKRDLIQCMWRRILDSSWCTLIFILHCVLQETCYSNSELWWWFFYPNFFNDSLNFIRKQVLHRLHNRMTNVDDRCTESGGC